MSETPQKNAALLAWLDELWNRPPQPLPPRRFKVRVMVSPRWRGELYLLPCVRFAWGREFEWSSRSYWVGLYWLQWSAHFGLFEVPA